MSQLKIQTFQDTFLKSASQQSQAYINITLKFLIPVIYSSLHLETFQGFVNFFYLKSPPKPCYSYSKSMKY
jgi:hypothetical protein